MSQRSTSLDTVQLIKKEIQELKEEYEEITRAKRISLLRKLNSEQALTKNLPPEILSLILQFSLAQLSTSLLLYQQTLIVGHVSFHWRQIVWSTPQLWKSMGAWVNYHTVLSTSHLLRIHLENVRGIPFSFYISFFSLPWPEEAPDPVLELLSTNEYGRKIHSLSLSSPSDSFTHNLSNGTFPCLEILTISAYGKVGPAEFALTNLPNLRRLTLQWVVPTIIDPSWPLVTHLTVEMLPINISIKLFIQCPNLVEAHIGESKAPSTSTSGLPWVVELTDTITYPHLKTLSWTYHVDPICLAVSQRIRAPSLQVFNWSNLSEVPSESLIPELAGNFPSISTITTLEFTSLEDCSYSFFRRIFAWAKQLQYLSFSCCAPLTITNALSVLHDGTGSKLRDQAMYLPLLNKLTIEDEDIPSFPRAGDWGWLIYKFLERRWRNGVCRFHLEMDIVFNWHPDVKDALRSLVEEGFELEIMTDNGDLVTWIDPNHPDDASSENEE